MVTEGQLRLSSNATDVGVLVSDWWDEINDSIQWQDGIFFFLCAAFALVASVALVRLSLPAVFSFSSRIATTCIYGVYMLLILELRAPLFSLLE